MARIHYVHPENPQARNIEQICDELAAGAVMLYPTDTAFAIGCDLNSKAAITRVRRLKQLSNNKPLTFLCPSLSDIAQYAYVKNPAYRFMKPLIPGPFAFILPATKLVPKIILNPQRKTTGIRVPDHPLCQALLERMGHPIISTSAHLPLGTHTAFDEDSGPDNSAELFDAFENLVDIIIDNGQQPTGTASTVIDLCQEEPTVLRKGLGWEIIEAQGLLS